VFTSESAPHDEKRHCGTVPRACGYCRATQHQNVDRLRNDESGAAWVDPRGEVQDSNPVQRGWAFPRLSASRDQCPEIMKREKDWLVWPSQSPRRKKHAEKCDNVSTCDCGRRYGACGSRYVVFVRTCKRKKFLLAMAVFGREAQQLLYCDWRNTAPLSSRYLL
jgi:hypothetical protein